MNFPKKTTRPPRHQYTPECLVQYIISDYFGVEPEGIPSSTNYRWDDTEFDIEVMRDCIKVYPAFDGYDSYKILGDTEWRVADVDPVTLIELHTDLTAPGQSAISQLLNLFLNCRKMVWFVLIASWIYLMNI